MNIIIYGISGRMGKVLLEAANNSDITVVAGIDKSVQKNSGVPTFASLSECDKQADVIIDFSKPAALDDIVVYANKTKTAVVFASTGHSAEQLATIETLAKTVPVFMASNMSVGVYLLNELSKTAARVLGESSEIEIVEKHHNRKVDAPSGTTVTLAKNINSVFDGQKTFTYGRTPDSPKRGHNEIGLHSVRGGTVVGDHDVLFLLSDETVTLSHTAQSPTIFALGAIKAARFVAKQKAGSLYGMTDLFK